MCKKLICLVSFVLVLGLALTSVVEAATDLVGHWKFDEGSGTTAYDSSGYGNHGTFNGNPQWVEGQLGGALDFDGDDSVEIPHNPSLSITDEITVTAWTKMRANASGELAIVSKGGWSANDLPYELTSVPGGVTAWQFYDDGGRDSCNTQTPPVDEWHHIAGTYDGQIFKLYIDGVLADEWAYVGKMPENTASVTIGQRSRGGTFFDGVIDEVAIYNRALSEDEIPQIMMGLSDERLASDPTPTDEATDVPRDVTLSWTPGEFAAPTNGHKVYFGQSFNDVNDGTGGITQDANSYAPAQRLDFNTNYYWRVDEVNAPPTSTVYRGRVWSFTTEPIAYAIPAENITATASSLTEDQGPENTVNGSGLDVNDLHSDELRTMWLSGEEPNGAWIEYELDKVHQLHEMWVWNYNSGLEPMIGLGLKDVSIEYSVNGTDYETLGTINQFDRAPGKPNYAHSTTVDFSGAAAKYVRITTINSNWGGGILKQFGLSEVRFFYIPVSAREPSPDSGTTDFAVDVTLGFRAGREAAEHNVYFSTDEQAVIDGNVPVITVTENSYSTSLDLDNTYYWRVDEVNNAETTTTWQGEIWNFKTHEYFVVDGFEDYNDYPPEEIWRTWVDGYGVQTNGATAGYPDPDFLAGENYAETAIVHGGSQSMPFFYSNTGTATYSEGERTFAVPQNWTEAGIQTLALYFHGTVGNTGQLYVKINGSKVVYGGDAGDIAKLRWKQWNINLASLGVNMQSVTTLVIGIEGNGASGTLYFDDIRLYRLAPEIVVSSEEIWIEAEAADTITDPMLIYDDPLASGGKYIGTDDGIGDENDAAPADGVATYNFTAQGGTYKIEFRVVITGGSNSFWVRIPSATDLTPGEDPGQPGTGWVRWNDISDGAAWHWDEVHSSDHGDAVANWTLAAGTHTLEIARREDGTLLDIIVISTID